MKVLVVGGGGREHAIVHHLVNRSRSSDVIAAPGNPGIATFCPTFDVAVDDVLGLVALAEVEQVEVAVIGPEVALLAGVADALRAAGIAVLGTGAIGAQLETSKSWAKALMGEAGIPTATASSFTDSASALDHLGRCRLPIVIKADGLAAGKGVVVSNTREEAAEAIISMLDDSRFGASGATLLIEEFLVGEEYSMMLFTDGESFVPMPLSQDHKPVDDGDRGPNTGGMGAYAPARGAAGVAEETIKRVFRPLLTALRDRGIDYRGVVTGNLIWTADGPYVIEFNARFGDPEAEVTLPLLKTDLAEIAVNVDRRTLSTVDVEWNDDAALCVALTAAGYPGTIRSGDVIEGLDDVGPGAIVFHAGTSRAGADIVTSRGRVVIVTGIGDTFEVARDRAYAAVAQIRFDGQHHRTDIGFRPPLLGDELARDTSA